MNKYNARRTVCNSKHVHDSKSEAQYCDILAYKKKSGMIRDYEVQKKFVLQPFYENETYKLKPITYIADFYVNRYDGTNEIIDVKGMQTEVFKLKWKLLKYTLRNEKNLHYIILNA